jgi:hypothetical protein
VIIAANPGESGTSHLLLDVIAARKQTHSTAIVIPHAFLADDLTLGILWALSNMDEALLNDDGALVQARQCVDHPAELNDSVIFDSAEMSAISRMWIGSDSCARFIARSTRVFQIHPSSGLGSSAVRKGGIKRSVRRCEIIAG